MWATLQAILITIAIVVGIVAGIFLLPLIAFVALAVAAIAFLVTLIFVGIREDLRRKKAEPSD